MLSLFPFYVVFMILDLGILQGSWYLLFIFMFISLDASTGGAVDRAIDGEYV